MSKTRTKWYPDPDDLTTWYHLEYDSADPDHEHCFEARIQGATAADPAAAFARAASKVRKASAAAAKEAALIEETDPLSVLEPGARAAIEAAVAAALARAAG